jgi:inosose dehydratase
MTHPQIPAIRVANAPCSWGILEHASGGRAPDADQVFDEMALAGYAGTELGDWGFLPTEPDALAAALERRSLTLVGGFVPVALARPGALAEGRERAIRTARLMGGAAPSAFVVLSDDCAVDPVRTGLAGRIQPEHGLDDAGWRVFAHGADEIARAVLGETGLRTVFHPHCAGYVETPAEIERLLDMTDPDALGLCLDTGHYSYGGGSDPVGAVRRAGDRLWHVHFKGFDPAIGQAARTDEVDYEEAVRRGVFCELEAGQAGGIDFAALLDHLRARDYRGWIVVEQDVLPGMGTPLDSARRSRAFLAALGL